MKPATLPAWARLARRAGINDKPLKLLFNKIRKETSDLMLNSVSEIAEYAACLTRVGACEEALSLLKSLPAEAVRSYPPVALYWAFLYSRDWNYAEALIHLQFYSASNGLDDYDRAISLLNLASCHLALGETAKAESTLLQLKKSKLDPSWSLLRTNILELQAQLDFKKRTIQQLWKLSEMIN